MFILRVLRNVAVVFMFAVVLSASSRKPTEARRCASRGMQCLVPCCRGLVCVSAGNRGICEPRVAGKERGVTNEKTSDPVSGAASKSLPTSRLRRSSPPDSLGK